MVFVDTSALLAVIDGDDSNHEEAVEIWTKLVSSSEVMVSHNYILVEMFALLQNRFGMQAIKVFVDDILPLLALEWVDETAHKIAQAALITAGKRKLSLVDCVSFHIMRELGIESAFTFDSHFAEQGFRSFR